MGSVIRELIVVEGQHDISAVKRAVEAELVATGGFALGPDTVARIRRAARHGGVIVLTDPDAAGEQIRSRVAALAEGCRHAWIPREACTRRGDGDIGVENASPDAIRAALASARSRVGAARTEFVTADLWRAGLDGAPGARERRSVVGARLGIGYGNARQLLARLNHYDVSRAEFEAACAEPVSAEP